MSFRVKRDKILYFGMGNKLGEKYYKTSWCDEQEIIDYGKIA